MTSSAHRWPFAIAVASFATFTVAVSLSARYGTAGCIRSRLRSLAGVEFAIGFRGHGFVRDASEHLHHHRCASRRLLHRGLRHRRERQNSGWLR